MSASICFRVTTHSPSENLPSVAIRWRTGLQRSTTCFPHFRSCFWKRWVRHIAVGDPCFARGEDAPIRNLLDHKQMCARENERTARRHEDLDVYYNVHTDITLPYEQLAALIGVRPDDTEVAIIREGRFVRPEQKR